VPSILIDNSQSGGCPMISGNPYSGRQYAPQSELVIVADPRNSGIVYVGLSGGVTTNSGGFPLSGGGLLDGMPIPPGASYSIPRMAFDKGGISGSFSTSGGFGIYLCCDAAASGRARVYWETY
jgi:hypothetical protein